AGAGHRAPRDAGAPLDPRLRSPEHPGGGRRGPVPRDLAGIPDVRAGLRADPARRRADHQGVDAQIADTVVQARRRVTVWIRPGTPERFRTILPAGVEIHELPPPDGQGRVGPAEFVVADFNRQGFLEVLPRLDGVKVVQAMSAGVDDLIGHIPDGVTLCDAAGVHDASVADWTVMAILAMYRRFPDLVAAQLDAAWRRPDFRQMRDLDGLSV